MLAPDLRGHGGSAAESRSFGWREADDAAAALGFLRRGAPTRRIAVLGVSLGGAAALLAQDGQGRADALILQAVFPDIRTAIRNRIAIRTGRLLVALAEPLLSYQSWLRYGVGPGRIAPISAIRHYQGPVLVIGGERDREADVADTRQLYAAAAGAKSLWLVPNADHNATCGLWNAEYRARVERFLSTTIGETIQQAKASANVSTSNVSATRVFSAPALD